MAEGSTIEISSEMSFFNIFGGQQANDKKSISKCNNVVVLMNGIDQDLVSISSMENETSQLKSEDADESKTTETECDSPEDELKSKSYHYEMIEDRLARIKTILYDESAASSQNPNDCPASFSALVADLITTHSGVIPLLLVQISSPDMPFEAKKDISAIFNSLMVRQFLSCSTPTPSVEQPPHHSNRFAGYVLDNYDSILTPIIHGHGAGTPDAALHCGSMLRSTLRHELLYRKLLTSKYVYPFLDTYVHLPNFDVASDALATVRDIFLMNRMIASQFLEREYTSIFSRFNKMLKSQNYITRRMSLKLLGEILLDRTNFGVMMKYISSASNLAIIMTLLSDPSGNIQFEAFHVFKIFVANPNKPEEVVRILTKNKVKLIKYLENFHAEREREDAQFRDEKRLILSTLNGLEG